MAFGGWSSDRFTVPMDDFICAICREVYRNAVSNPCGHTFCETCLRQSIRQVRQCPSCRIPIPPSVPAFSLRLAIQNSPIHCENHEYGCGVVCLLQDMTAHQQLCEFQHKPCDECNEQVQTNQLEHHQTHLCVYRLVACRQCQATVSFHEQESHIVTSCGQTSQTCDLCDWKGVREDAHLLVCPFVVVACKYKAYGCDVEQARNQMPAHEESSHTDCLCRTIDRVHQSMDQFQMAHLQEGPFRVAGHPHRVYLCSDLQTESCSFCQQPIKVVQTNAFGYTCGLNCSFFVCIECVGQRRLYKSKRSLADTILLVL